MSFLDTLLGTENKLSDKDIASDMIKDSKFGVTSLSSAAAEAVNPQLRDMLRGQLDMSVKEHFALSDLAMRKGWYPAFENPQAQLCRATTEAQQIQMQ